MIPEGAPPEFPTNLLEFQRMFPDEAACLSYLRRLRWPGGFVCEACKAVGEPFLLATRPRVVKCRACERESSATAGTILHGTKTSLQVWFWAAYLVATQTSEISALGLQKQLGIRGKRPPAALITSRFPCEGTAPAWMRGCSWSAPSRPISRHGSTGPSMASVSNTSKRM